MQFNATTGYALQIMLYLTKNRRTVSSMELAENITVSKRYLMQIASKLRSGGLVVTRIGVSGGYTLLKEPALISAYDIIVLMEGGVFVPESLTTSLDNILNLNDVLKLLTEYIETYLRSMTLDKLADRNINEWHGKFTETVEMHIASLNPKLRKNTEDGSIFTKKEKSVWICRKCGYIVDNENAPRQCHVCAHPQAYFELRAINY